MPDPTNRPLRVFLCHSSKDKAAVRELYKKLRLNDWLDPWLDEEKLLPGQDWHMEIEKAVEVTDVVMVLLSNQSVSQEGYVQRELKLALDVADEKPEGAIFIVPLRLDDCPAPRRLRGWQYVDYFPADRKDWALERVIASLKLRADSLGLKFGKNISPVEKTSPKSSVPVENTGNVQIIINGDVIGSNLIAGNDNQSNILEEKLASKQEAKIAEKVVEEKKPVIEKYQPAKIVETISNKLVLSNGMEFMRVPAGKFLMGSTKENKLADDDERPQHTVDLPEYWMARFPTTNEQYNAFVKAKGLKHPVKDWTKKTDHPVIYVKWSDALAYCQWLNDLLKKELPSGLILRLPTEAEWEKAARGSHLLLGEGRGQGDVLSLSKDEVNEWPWGNEFDKNKCNSIEGGKGSTTPVGSYSPQGDSPYGCADMAGNVWEWTHSLKKKYPYNVLDGREAENASGARVLRGGSFVFISRYARCAFRSVFGFFIFLNFDYGIGFRVVASPNLS